MRKSLETEIVSAISEVFCAQNPPSVIPFSFDPVQVPGWRRCRKRLKAARHFSVQGQRVHGKQGVFVDALAKWADTLTFTVGLQTFRYRTLLICRGDIGFGFAIRAIGKSHPTVLPGIDWDPVEVDLLFAIADELSEPGKDKPIELVNHVRRRSIAALADETEEYPSGKLLQLFHVNVVRETFFVGVLAGIECFRSVNDRSLFAVNFLLQRGGGTAAGECVHTILRALDFTVRSPYIGCPAIEIKEKSDLGEWWSRRGQLTLLKYAAEKAIRTIWREAEHRSLVLSPSSYPALPLLLGRSSLPPSVVYELILPAECPILLSGDLQMLRAAAAHILRERHRLSELMQQQFRWLEVSGAEFVLTYPDAFVQCFSHTVGEILFENPAERQIFYDICGENEMQKQLKQAEDARILDSALQLLLDPNRYADGIVEKPASNAEAESLLQADAFAFYYAKAKAPALCFSETSILRLLRQVGFREELFDRFIQQLRSQSILKEKRETIHFPESTNGRFFTIPIEKCKNFNVSAITA